MEVLKVKKDKDNPDKDDAKLRNYSQVLSDERLSDLDVEVTSKLIAGGDISLLEKDINDEDEDT